MQSLDLTELERVDYQADVAAAGEPGAVVLVARLGAVADAVLFDGAVTADVKDRRGGTGRLRKIEVARDVKSRARLKLDILDRKLRMLDAAGDGRLQRTLLGRRVEPEHVGEPPPGLAAPPRPVLQGLDVCQAALLEACGLGPEVRREARVGVAGIGQRLDEGRAEDGEEDEQGNEFHTGVPRRLTGVALTGQLQIARISK